MKRPKWSARLLYIAVALALVIGLTPVVATTTPVVAGYVDVYLTGPDYEKKNEPVTFIATAPEADKVDFYIDYEEGDEPEYTDETTSPFEFPYTFDAVGVYVIRAVAHWGQHTQIDEHHILIGEGLIPQVDYNIVGSYSTFRLPQDYTPSDVVRWRYESSFPFGGEATIRSGGQPAAGPYYDPEDPGPHTSVTVHANNVGELAIYVDLEDGTTLTAMKKWGKIYDTDLYGAGETEIVWNSEKQVWEGTGLICDEVTGQFVTNMGFTYTRPASGADLQWWVMRSTAPVDDLPHDLPAADDWVNGELQPGLVTLINAMQAANPSMHVGFEYCETKRFRAEDPNPNLPSPFQMVDAVECVTLVPCGPEAVKIVVVAKYPHGHHSTQWPVFPQILSWNFYKPQEEKVPQVAWIGEKVVLEKYFGTGYRESEVRFALESPSVGTLVPIGSDGPGGTTVLTTVGSDGVARVIIESETHGEAHVKASLYHGYYEPKTQHGFIVYFLAFEGVSLGNVYGQREGHDDGLFVPENPWDTGTDTVSTELNVSQDTLLRARVQGWFMHSVYRSPRPALTNAGGWETAPAGRIVLPDDWPLIAAGPEAYDLGLAYDQAPHWDIMTQPTDNVMSLENPLGDYHWWDSTTPDFATEGPLVAEADVIGPYSSLDDYTSSLRDPLDRKTIVPNSKLNWWDCPMPPAKIGFRIMDGPGYFKEAEKTDIYYQWVKYYFNLWGIAYTNPFYEMMIPASPFIPPYIIGGGYDWDSWGFEGHEFGPYPFWQFINTTPRDPKVLPSGVVEVHNDPQHPTYVWVYSDNHGEAMVYLNGDWNLDLGTPPYEIPTDTVVGETTVRAFAHYPYLRDGVVISDPVEKRWEWGVDIRGYGHFGDDWRMVIQTQNIDKTAPDATTGFSDMKMAFLWITDRAGMPIEGARVEWRLSADNGAEIANYDGFPGAMAAVHDLEVVDGFLAGTDGDILNPERTVGVSYTIIPDADGDEAGLWEKVWGDQSLLPPEDQITRNHGVAGVLIHSDSLSTHVELRATIYHPEGKLTRKWNLDFQEADPQNPCLDAFRVEGDVIGNGVRDHRDVLAIQRVIHGLETCPDIRAAADLNGDGNVDIRDIYKLITIWKG